MYVRRTYIPLSCAAAEKRKYGYYDDSRGMRYLPPGLYIKIGDFSGGLTYLRWFLKNFPDDIGFPDFLFEWTIILFKTGKLQDAEKKAFETFCGNTYLFDRFFGKPIVPIDKYEFSNLQQPEFAEQFAYSYTQPEIADFTAWLEALLKKEKFKIISAKFIDINKRLIKAENAQNRQQLLEQVRQLERQY